MLKFTEIFTPAKILEETDSSVNGKITVVKSLGWGIYFQVGGLTQSGGVVKSIWKTTLKKIRKSGHTPRKILILGLGGGSLAELCANIWPDAHMVGVDLDEIIVNLGKKYLNLGNKTIDIIISDAFTYVRKIARDKNKYDLVITDLYVGQEFPVIFESDRFLKNVKEIITNGGIAVFNRLYFDDKRSKSQKFGKKLSKYFNNVEYFFPEANLMLICSK